jgi:hypothetical protein
LETIMLVTCSRQSLSTADIVFRTYTELAGPKGDDLVALVDLLEASGLPRAELLAAVDELRRRWVLSALADEGRGDRSRYLSVRTRDGCAWVWLRHDRAV